jgi:membrane fusion protein (multidrug efflux system)
MPIAATNKPTILTTGAQGDQKTDHAPKRPSGEDVGQNEGVDRPSQEEQPDLKKKKKRPLLMFLIGGVILLIILFFGYRYWQHASTHEDTDDAYTTGNTHQISPRVAGTVQQVLVDDNWHVNAGQALVKLDPRDFEVALVKNKAQLKQATAQVSQAEAAAEQASAELLQRQAEVTQAAAQVIQSKANFDIAKINFDRSQALFLKGAVSKEDVDTTRTNFDAARGALDGAKATDEANQAQVVAGKAAVDSAKAQIENSVANVSVSEATVHDSELQLSYCSVIAPVSGRIAQRSVESGNRMTVGQALMAVVEDDVWILANFKESQLERMQIGQPVEITIDAMPHHKFSGRVDSLQPGTGSDFALLPPDNATGNFIKIVQRVPVKILFDPSSIANVREKIVPGLSTESSVAITETPTSLPYARMTGEKAAPPDDKPITQEEGRPAPGIVQ